MADTTDLMRNLDNQIARENIAWWDNLRQEHLRKGQTIAAGKCEEEIALWRQEIGDEQLKESQ